MVYIFLVFLLSISLIQTKEEEKPLPRENNIIILDDKTFEDFMLFHPYVLVKFYKPNVNLFYLNPSFFLFFPI